MTVKVIFVIIVLAIVVLALIKDRMRPGLILLSGAVVFLCAGILTPREMLEGFSNKGMITVALLFLVSEGVRRSGMLEEMLRRLLPQQRGISVRRVQLRLLPIVSFVSAFLNNTPVVVIFAPMIKRWAEKHGVMCQRNWQADITPARRDLGYKPAWPLTRGVHDTREWYRTF